MVTVTIHGPADKLDPLSPDNLSVVDSELSDTLDPSLKQLEKTMDAEADLIEAPTDSEETDNSTIEGIAAPSQNYNSPFPEALVADDIFLSVLSERPSAIKSIDAPKPTVEMTQTFLQELTSFWKDDGLTVTELSETSLSEIVRHSPEFLDDLNKMRQDLDQSAETQQIKQELSAEAVTGVSMTITAGFVSWALRGGSLFASFLTAMPAWRSLDVMPILAADEKSRTTQSTADGKYSIDNTDKEEEAKVDHLFDQ